MRSRILSVGAPRLGAAPLLTVGATSGGSALPAVLADYNLEVAGSRWQDAAATVAATSAGDPIRRLNDVSGNGHHLKSPDDSHRPLLGVSSGHYLASFNNSILSQLDDTFADLGAVTLALVASLSEAGLVGLATTGGSLKHYIYKNDVAADCDLVGSSDLISPYDDGALHVFVYVITPGGAKPRAFYVGGSLNADSATNIGSSTSAARLHLGAISPGTGLGISTIRRCILYPTALDAGQVATLSATLATLHGVP